MSSMKASKLAALSASVTIGFATFGPAKAETSISWVPARAPAELLACTRATIANDTSEEAQQVLAQLTESLIQSAIRSKIAKIGEPFVFRVIPGQVDGTYPISLDFCMPIEKKPVSSDIAFQYIEVPERAIRLGLCASASSADCQAAVDSAVAPMPIAAKTDKEATKDASKADSSPAPKLNGLGIRSGPWQSAAPPADVAAMQAAVYRMWPPAEAPFGGGTTAGGDGSQPAPRELGKIPGNTAVGSATARIDAPNSPPVVGFIFSVPPQ